MQQRIGRVASLVELVPLLLAAVLAGGALAATTGASAPTAAFDLGVASGGVRATSAVVWARAGRSGPVTLELWQNGGPVRRISAVASPDHDLTVTVRLSRLRPQTAYLYRFRQGRSASRIGHFATGPLPSADVTTRFIWSGDSDGRLDPATGQRLFGDWPLFDTIASEHAQFFVYLGDTIYADHGVPAQTVDDYRFKYRWYRSRPMRNLLASTAAEIAWDDHEVTDNYSGETVDPTIYANGVAVFHEYWPLPASRSSREYETFRWGKNLQIFILDDRSYRSSSALGACENPPGSGLTDLAPLLPQQVRDGLKTFVAQLALPVPDACLAALRDPSRTFLGTEQERWLLDSLARSTATWKVIMTPLPIQAWGLNPYDHWEGYQAARAHLLSSMVALNLKNVVFLSADTHATMVKDVTLNGQPTGIKEVVTGPIGAVTYAKQVEIAAGPQAGAALADVLKIFGATCAVVDTFSYGVVTAGPKTLTIDPRDAQRRSICGGKPALVLHAS